MADYIDRDAAMRFNFSITVPLDKKIQVRDAVLNTMMEIVSYIEAIPAADVAPVRHGRWETVMLDHERMGCRPTAHYCSECHQITWFRTFYCPNCGAKMDGGADDGRD